MRTLYVIQCVWFIPIQQLHRSASACTSPRPFVSPEGTRCLPRTNYIRRWKCSTIRCACSELTIEWQGRSIPFFLPGHWKKDRTLLIKCYIITQQEKWGKKRWINLRRERVMQFIHHRTFCYRFVIVIIRVLLLLQSGTLTKKRNGTVTQPVQHLESMLIYIYVDRRGKKKTFNPPHPMYRVKLLHICFVDPDTLAKKRRH